MRNKIEMLMALNSLRFFPTDVVNTSSPFRSRIGRHNVQAVAPDTRRQYGAHRPQSSSFWTVR